MRPQKLLKEILPHYIEEKMGEGGRLKNEILSQNSTQQQSNQSQHPQQKTVPENTLKETYTNNNIEYNIMERSDQIVLDYILSSEKGEILKRNGQ